MAARNAKVAPFDDEEIIRLVPYYAIEAWLLQNFDEGGSTATMPADRAQLAQWHNDRGLLDELRGPHEFLSIGKSNNLSLSNTLLNVTVRDVVGVGKSLATIVAKLQLDGALKLAAMRSSH